MIALALLLAFAHVEGDGVRLEFDERMRSRVVATFAGETVLGTVLRVRDAPHRLWRGGWFRAPGSRGGRR